MQTIHSKAIIEPGAIIGENVLIEAYVIVKSNVILEDNVVIKSHAYIDGYTTIGQGTIVWPFASIGTKTQDKKFIGEKTFVFIGRNCEIREFVTINSSCGENSNVSIGDNCLIMAYCHVAHNCIIGSNVIMANSVMLAGHVNIEDHVVIGGMTPVHQFVRIGKYAMVGGFSRVTHDIPPYTIGAGFEYEIRGLNLIGLKRHGIPLGIRKKLHQALSLVYRSDLTLEKSLKIIEETIEMGPHLGHFIDFCRNSTRGLSGRNRKSSKELFDPSIDFQELVMPNSL